MRFFILALGFVVAVAIEQTTAAQASGTVWSGVYSNDQTKRGQALYGQECSSCHGPAMEGNDEAPPLAGAAFAANWDGRKLGELFDIIRLSMPANDPGNLTPQQNADILAYMLTLGRFPAGKTALPSETDALNLILFAATKP